MSDPFNPYATTYIHTTGPGDSRPTALQIVKDNDRVGEWKGRVALVTGGTSGIGVETARALHATGADVYITARDLAKGQATKADILERSNGVGQLKIIELDLDSLESVRQAATSFLNQSDRLDILVNNAGIMASPYSKTVDGFERQFAVNHLAHYLLTTLLLPTLISSSTPSLSSRVVFVSSSSHRYSKIRWDDYNYNEPGSYDPHGAYGQSKTGSIWTANYIDRTFGARGVHALSLHPGGIWTGLQEFSGADKIAEWKQDAALMSTMLSAEQGAATTLWAAVDRVWEGKGGEYLADCRVAPLADNLTSAVSSGAAPWVKEPQSEDRLWALSAKLVGVAKLE